MYATADTDNQQQKGRHSTMANQKQTSTKRMKMAERAQQQLDLHFPDVPAPWLWRRKTNDGFTTVPRTLPIVMQAVDDQNKGQPPGHTLFCLWARSPDNPLVTIENPATFASEAGFEGERAVYTWRRRMKALREAKMIATKPGPSGEFHYVLLLNPNVAVEYMRQSGKVQDGLYSRFIDRLFDVGGGGELEAIRAMWEEERAAKAAAESAAAAGATAPAPASSEVITAVEVKV